MHYVANTVRSEVAVHLQKVLQVISTSVDTVKTELNNYTLCRYCTSTAVWQLNTVKQQHTSTATSILTTKSTYRSLSAQRLSERNV
jgi:hypothetical protein